MSCFSSPLQPLAGPWLLSMLFFLLPPLLISALHFPSPHLLCLEWKNLFNVLLPSLLTHSQVLLKLSSRKISLWSRTPSPFSYWALLQQHCGHLWRWCDWHLLLCSMLVLGDNYACAVGKHQGGEPLPHHGFSFSSLSLPNKAGSSISKK